MLQRPLDIHVLDDVDICVIEVDPEQFTSVASRLRARPGLLRGVIVGISNAAVSPERRRMAIQAGFSELLCGPCGPEALLALVERLRTIRPDDVPCEPDSPQSNHMRRRSQSVDTAATRWLLAFFGKDALRRDGGQVVLRFGYRRSAVVHKSQSTV